MPAIAALAAATGAMYRDDLYSQISDTYKEIHGIRPRWINPAELSTAELEALVARLYAESAEALAAARREEVG